jgi:hypothetical protein
VITREDLIEQSVTNFVRDGLTAFEYVPRIADVREAFPAPAERDTTLSKTQVALGFNFDDGGRLAELGSDLTEFMHTAEVWVFGRTQAEGRNTANAIRAIVLTADTIPLIDVRDNSRPVIDQLIKPERQAVVVARQIAADPRPWDRFVWTATIKLEDTYSPASFYAAGP